MYMTSRYGNGESTMGKWRKCVWGRITLTPVTLIQNPGQLTLTHTPRRTSEEAARVDTPYGEMMAAM